MQDIHFYYILLLVDEIFWFLRRNGGEIFPLENSNICLDVLQDISPEQWLSFSSLEVLDALFFPSFCSLVLGVLYLL